MAVSSLSTTRAAEEEFHSYILGRNPCLCTVLLGTDAIRMRAPLSNRDASEHTLHDN
jgi:hypothetical protein